MNSRTVTLEQTRLDLDTVRDMHEMQAQQCSQNTILKLPCSPHILITVMTDAGDILCTGFC